MSRRSSVTWLKFCLQSILLLQSAEEGGAASRLLPAATRACPGAMPHASSGAAGEKELYAMLWGCGSSEKTACLSWRACLSPTTSGIREEEIGGKKTTHPSTRMQDSAIKCAFLTVPWQFYCLEAAVSQPRMGPRRRMAGGGGLSPPSAWCKLLLIFIACIVQASCQGKPLTQDLVFCFVLFSECGKKWKRAAGNVRQFFISGQKFFEVLERRKMTSKLEPCERDDSVWSEGGRHSDSHPQTRDWVQCYLIQPE